MTKEQVLLVVQEAIKKNTDKSSMGLAYEQGFEDGAKYALQKLEQCNVKRRFSLEEFIWSKAFPTEPYNADDYYDWARENATYALNLAYEYCSENGV